MGCIQCLWMSNEGMPGWTGTMSEVIKVRGNRYTQTWTKHIWSLPDQHLMIMTICTLSQTQRSTMRYCLRQSYGRMTNPPGNSWEGLLSLSCCSMLWCCYPFPFVLRRQTMPSSECTLWDNDNHENVCFLLRFDLSALVFWSNKLFHLFASIVYINKYKLIILITSFCHYKIFRFKGIISVAVHRKPLNLRNETRIQIIATHEKHARPALWT